MDNKHATLPPLPPLCGCREAVVIVSDLASYTTVFIEVAGWTVLAEGETDAALLEHWQLPAGARGRYAVLANPEYNSGCIRLMQFEGVAQQMIRPHTQTWDTGGILDLNIRVVDMARKQAQLEALGWQANSEPVTWQFGPFRVQEWLVRGPDGLSLALIERLDPPLEGWPHLKEFSHTFNSTQVVRDLPASLAFYRDTLGFGEFLHERHTFPEAGPNVLGMPHNLASTILHEIYILHPEAACEGSIELLTYEGLEGRDLADRAHPPNLGAAVLRFPLTEGIGALARRLAASGAMARRSRVLNLAPWGEVELLSTQAPEGAWLEFYQPANI